MKTALNINTTRGFDVNPYGNLRLSLGRERHILANRFEYIRFYETGVIGGSRLSGGS